MSVELTAPNGLNEAELVLERLPALVGKSADADGHVEHHSAGGYQCLIGRVDNELVVWDLGSRSGTFVNGTRVTQANLKAGDRLALGVTEFSVRIKDRPRRYMHGVRN